MIQRLFALAAVLLLSTNLVAQDEDLGELKLFELADLTAAPFEHTNELLGQAVLFEHFAHW